MVETKEGYVLIRSGYGIHMKIGDKSNQEQKTEHQYLEFFCPQYTNKAGPHRMVFQEDQSPESANCFLRIGGYYVVSSYHHQYVIVGDKDHMASKLSIVSQDYILNVGRNYLNGAKMHVFLADEQIWLLAGKDCPTTSGDLGPCPYPVLVYTPRGIAISDRVYASASPDSKIAPVWALQPFMKGETV
jgi:hypothetical protein